ncbi:MAG TPA: glycosyltransferase family 9 protein [Flavisolibacter sp.]|nr:glycosyltransferase family 9 protein [Flavisolibacter sp.]
MKILVRLPNWLGDMVMSVAALHQLRECYPGAVISVIVKGGLQDLLPFFPPVEHTFIFSKEKYSGLSGVWRFGRTIKATENFDLFISFPDSFSSALMGLASGAKRRVGYKKEGREILLTSAYSKQHGLHRVEEYVKLAELYADKKSSPPSVLLKHSFKKGDDVVLNINSEASSRRLTKAKAVEIIAAVRESITNPIMLIGAPNESAFVEEVWAQLPVKNEVYPMAGKTSLAGLCEVLASAKLVLTTDSGPAHLANALGTQTVVLFGAGNENNTSPYNRGAVHVIRLGKLSCEPCTKNICVQFGTPQCLELLDTANIISVVNQTLL